MNLLPVLGATGLAVLLSACASSDMAKSSTMAAMPMAAAQVDNMALPEAVRVPAGQTLKLLTTGVGEITYECREKKDMAGQHEWVFVAPVATLYGSNKATVGKYYAGPTWEANDGSKVSGKQVAVAPAGAGNIPLQLVKTDPAMGAGAMQGLSYIQRLNTRGGVAPAMACDASSKGQRQQVKYAADYAFYGA